MNPSNEFFFETLNSTNDALKELLKKQKLEEFTIVRADFQISGRGQKGNTWESAKGKNLLFTVLLKPIFIPIKKQFIISQIVSLALKETLDTLIDSVTIKWPNDIYYKDSKLCGILIENILSEDKIESSIIGVGLNVNQESFCSDAPNPISLFQILGRTINRDDLLQLFMNKLRFFYKELINKDWVSLQDMYFQSLYRLHKEFYFEDANGRFKASIEAVDSLGFLSLRHSKSNLIHQYAFKEVKYIL